MKYNGVLVGELRGSMAGITASRNSSGSYIRKKVTPVNPQTDAQMEVRSIFGALASSWSGLTEAERNSFNVQAPNYPNTDVFGNSAPLTGQQLFQRLNNQLLQLGQTVTSLAVPPIEVGGAFSTEIHLEDTDFQIFNLSDTEANEVIAVYATAPQGAGIKYPQGGFKLISVKAAGVGTLDYDIAAAYAAKFSYTPGQIPVGSKVFIRLRRVSLVNGQASADNIYTGTKAA